MTSILKSLIAVASNRKLSPIIWNKDYSTAAAMVVAKKFIYAKRFVGEPKPSDFTLEEETLPALKDGGAFNEYLNQFECHSNLFILLPIYRCFG